MSMFDAPAGTMRGGRIRDAPGVSVEGGLALGARAPLAWRALVAAALLSLLVGVGIHEGFAGRRASVPAAAQHPRSWFSREGLLSLPLAAQGPVAAALGADSPAYRVKASAEGFQAASPAQRLHSTFSRSGVLVSSGRTQVGLSLTGVGFGSRLRSLGAVAPTAHGNRVIYQHSGLSEWYADGPLGLEQGFTVSRAAAGHGSGPLTLSLTLSGNARAALVKGGQSLTLSHAGAPALRYSRLSVVDAAGRPLHSWLELQGGRLVLRVDARGARFPVKIDPFVEQAKLTGGGIGNESFGLGVALSADGNTAMVGGPWGSVGAVWVFTRSGSTWTEQAKFTGGAGFGYQVALSGEGNTAVIGEYEYPVSAAWVWNRSGSTWTEQQQLPYAGGNAVALSFDGNTALTGTWYAGFASVYTRPAGDLSPGAWTEQQRLTGSGDPSGWFGSAVALSPSGDTALVSDKIFNDGGAAWVFTRSGSTWTEQAKLTGSGEYYGGGGEFGLTVALPEDGNTALVGSNEDAAWVFTRSGTTWSEQQELHAEAWGVALGNDGNLALLGSNGSEATVFTRPAGDLSPGAWTEQQKLTAQDVGNFFGADVALSEDGETALIGDVGDTSVVAPDIGAAWVFTNSALPPAPAVVTGAASQVTQTTATLAGTVNPNGGDVTSCVIEYGTSLPSGSSVACSPSPGSGTSAVAVTGAVTGLAANTTYQYRVIATNAGGTGTGASESFTTAPSAGAGTQEASSVTKEAATLNGGVDPHGGGLEECEFEYGTSTNYGSAVPCENPPTEPVSYFVNVSATVKGLMPNTIYYYRLRAKDLGQPSPTYGAGRGLTTLLYSDSGATTASLSNGLLSATASDGTGTVTVGQYGSSASGLAFESDKQYIDVYVSPGSTFQELKFTDCDLGTPAGTIVEWWNRKNNSGAEVYEPVSNETPNSTTTPPCKTVTAKASGTTPTIAAMEGKTEATIFAVIAPPTVVSGAAESITDSSAILEGEVDPNGGKVATCEVEYGETDSYGYEVPCTYLWESSGTSPIPVFAAAEELNPDTTYHYRFVAENAAGTSYGADRTFMTKPEPPTITTISPTEGKAAGGTVVKITGTHLAGAIYATFGETNVPASCSETECTTSSPAGTGTVSVTVTTAGGTSNEEAFWYVPAGPAPTITGLSPATGPETGGTTVTITGTGFTGATAVKFGPGEAIIKSYGASSLTVESPKGKGTVYVTVTTPNGTSPGSGKGAKHAKFKYEKAKIKK